MAAFGMKASDIRGRCKPVGDCLEWRSDARSKQRLRHPAALVEGEYVLLRRALYEHEKAPLAEGRYLRPTCINPRCIEPEHQLVMTEATKNSYGSRKATASATRAAKVSATRLARGLNKLTSAQVQEVKESTEPAAVLAARMGCHEDTIGQIRRGKIYRDYANPFEQLMRRAA